MLHQLAVLSPQIKEAYATFDYKRVVALLSLFMNVELSSFYFDIRKDTLYCEPKSSDLRKSSLYVINEIFKAVTTWLSPILSFTSEEAWLSRFGDGGSVHLEQFPSYPAAWQNDMLDAKWEKIRAVRRVVTGALEVERAAKVIGSSLEASPSIYIEDNELYALVKSVDMAEIAITSDITLHHGAMQGFTLEDVAGVSVVFKRALGIKCERSWKYFDASTAVKGYEGVTPRDAKALMELGL
jgi:isoleucyl-tRNA synthetase